MAVNVAPFNLRRNRIAIVLCLGTICVVLALLKYYSWKRGRVVATLTHSGYTFCIREIPLQLPGLNDGYTYRCEVWSKGILTKASTDRWDSYIAFKTSIAVSSSGAVPGMIDTVTFDLDGHKISCRPFGNTYATEWTNPPPE